MTKEEQLKRLNSLFRTDKIVDYKEKDDKITLIHDNKKTIVVEKKMLEAFEFNNSHFINKFSALMNEFKNDDFNKISACLFGEAIKMLSANGVSSEEIKSLINDALNQLLK